MCQRPECLLHLTCAQWVLLCRANLFPSFSYLFPSSFHCCSLHPALCPPSSCSANSGMSIPVLTGLSYHVFHYHNLLCSVHISDSVSNLPSVPLLVCFLPFEAKYQQSPFSKWLISFFSFFPRGGALVSLVYSWMSTMISEKRITSCTHYLEIRQESSILSLWRWLRLVNI